jgi:hypothetical protein
MENEQQSKFHALLGRGLTDHDFREALKDPERQVEALQSMGIGATSEVLDALNDSIEALDRLASSEALGPYPAVG